MKRIWFTQQKPKPFTYIPLRVGLGEIETDRLEDINFNRERKLCPKIYTTRTRKMSGEYYVVEGSRFKAKPLLPRIEFKVEKVFPLNLRTETTERIFALAGSNTLYPGLSFPELDLGYMGATFEDLKCELLKLNKDTTLDTKFFINKLEPLEGSKGEKLR